MIQIKNPFKKTSESKKVVKDKPKDRLLSEIASINSLSELMKLRLIIGIIVLLMTIAFGLAITSEFVFSVALILIAYFSLLVILIKLFLIKNI